MIRKKPTLNDIAREAGVSQTTVSLAFSGKGRISDEIKERIFTIADQLGYKKLPPQPSIEADKAINAAILLHMEYEYLWSFFQPTIEELESKLNHAGMNLVIVPINYRGDAADIYRKITAIQAGAVFSLHYADIDLFNRLEKQGIPVIILHNCDHQERFNTVSFDDLQGAWEAARHLISYGHKDIAYVEYVHKDLFSLKNDRFYGFRKALEENNISFSEEMKIAIDYNNLNETKDKLSQLFRRKKIPTAIFIHDDYLALRVIDALNQMNLKVPDDVSVIAPGDVLVYSEPHVPGITTMRINSTTIGRLAADMMFNCLNNNSDEIQVLKVKEQLVKRGSCKNLLK